IRPSLELARGDTVHPPGELNVLATWGERVEGRSLRRQAQSSPDVGWMRPDIESRDAGDAARRPQQRGQDSNRRGLARTVGAEKAEELARVDAEGDAVDGARAAGVHLGQVLDFDDWAGHRVEIS